MYGQSMLGTQSVRIEYEFVVVHFGLVLLCNESNSPNSGNDNAKLDFVGYIFYGWDSIV